MKSEMKNQLLRALIRELKMYTSWEPRLGRVWLNGSIDMIQVQGFQYDPVYYQLLEPLSTGVQQRFSHTFGKYFILFWRHHGALWSTDCHPPGGHSSLSTTPSYPTPAQVSPWKMNERLQWKLLADIIIHLHQHYHHWNISSTPPHHSPGHIRGPIKEQLWVRWGEANQWGLSVAVMMSNWCGILKCSFSQHLPSSQDLRAQLF